MNRAPDRARGRDTVAAVGAGDTPQPAQLSIQVPNFAQSPSGWQASIDLAVAADRAGVDRVVVSDHILYGERLDAYGVPSLGGTAGGRQPTDPDGHWLEPLTLLALLAGVTSRVRLGTAVLLAALRPPAVLAKQAATLDVLSGGRLDLGVGVGWQREEYAACGLDFGRRGELLDRCLLLCTRLWTEQVVDFDDGELRLERVHAMPKPAQPGGVPVWVSGRATPRVVARVARFGAGWIPWGDDIVDPRNGVKAMRQGLEDASRDPRSLQVQGTLPTVRGTGGEVDVDATMAGVPNLLEAGVTDFRFHHRWVDPHLDGELLAAVVGAFRKTVGRA